MAATTQVHPWHDFGPVPAERLWAAALTVSDQAEAAGLLVPLQTQLLDLDHEPFVIRRLLGATPKHLRAAGPRPNPFLPWEPGLQVNRLGQSHIVLLNKYPVQRGHLLVISADWKPQSGWLETADWQAVAAVSQDTSGLWFFNSCAAAGASQPHRHLQLLPRKAGDTVCPLEPLYVDMLKAKPADASRQWRFALSRRHAPGEASELRALYHQHCLELGLGSPQQAPQPLAPYNLLFSDHWLLTVRRTREHSAGFSVNALGFAGYLLATDDSDLGWLRQHGPWCLLKQVAAAP